MQEKRMPEDKMNSIITLEPHCGTVGIARIIGMSGLRTLPVLIAISVSTILRRHPGWVTP